jgi:chromosome segregation ATPase
LYRYTRVLAEQVEARTAREQELLEQLVSYADRFKEFQGMITSSNEAFGTFKTDMAELSKALRSSEKGKAELEAKTRKSDVAMIQLLEERENAARANGTLRAQKEKLEGLCRVLTLQAKLVAGGPGVMEGGVELID